MSKILAVATLFLMLAGTSGGVDVLGNISSDTMWTSGETVRVTGPVTVLAGKHLTIEAGTVIYFTPGTGLYVNGELSAMGSEDARIVFTASADTILGQPTAGSWSGIRFNLGAAGSLEYCDITWATKAVCVYQSGPMISHCTLENFLSHGVYAYGLPTGTVAKPIVEHCDIRQTDSRYTGTGLGIYAYYCTELTVHRTDISNCSNGIDLCAYKTYAQTFEISECAIRNNATMGLYLHAVG